MDDFFDGVGEFWDDTTEVIGGLFDEATDTISNAWDQVSIMRDPPNQQYNSAQKVFGTAGEGGYTKFNIPKMKYSFIVEFVLTPFAKRFIKNFLPDSHTAFSEINASYFVRDVQLPSQSFELDVVNQYNRTRIQTGKMTYKPITMTFFDTTDSSALLLFDAYRNYYYGDSFLKTPNSYRNDSLSAPNAFEGISQHWGRTIVSNGDYDSQYFFKQINIYEIDNDRYTVHNMFNVYISDFQPDMKSHDSTGEPSAMTLTFNYEGLNNFNPDGLRSISAPTIEIAPLILSTSSYGKSGFFKMFGAMDDKMQGLGSMGNILRAGTSVYDLSRGVGDIISGNATPDTIRNMGSAISVGSDAIGFGDVVSDANNSFGLGNILGDF